MDFSKYDRKTTTSEEEKLTIQKERQNLLSNLQKLKREIRGEEQSSIDEYLLISDNQGVSAISKLHGFKEHERGNAENFINNLSDAEMKELDLPDEFAVLLFELYMKKLNLIIPSDLYEYYDWKFALLQAIEDGVKFENVERIDYEFFEKYCLDNGLSREFQDEISFYVGIYNGEYWIDEYSVSQDLGYINKYNIINDTVYYGVDDDPDSYEHLNKLGREKIFYNWWEVDYLKIEDFDLVKKYVPFEKLINLTELDLSENDLTEFPVEVFKIPYLRKLDLSENNIKTIPEEILDTHLSIFKLCLYGNPIDKKTESWIEEEKEKWYAKDRENKRKREEQGKKNELYKSLRNIFSYRISQLEHMTVLNVPFVGSGMDMHNTHSLFSYAGAKPRKEEVDLYSLTTLEIKIKKLHKKIKSEKKYIKKMKKKYKRLRMKEELLQSQIRLSELSSNDDVFY